MHPVSGCQDPDVTESLNTMYSAIQICTINCALEAGLKGKGKEQVLRKITEKEELNKPSAQLPSLSFCQLSVTGRESLQENSPGKETPDEKITPLSESVTNDYKIDSFSSSSELASGLTLEHDVSSCLLSSSVRDDSYTKSTEKNESSFSSPELFRGSGYLDWKHPKLEEYKPCKNSTILDTSKAVTIEKVLQLENLSEILGSSSENYEKCQRKIGMTLEALCISAGPKYTSNLASVSSICYANVTGKEWMEHMPFSQENFEKDQDNAASEVIFAEKTGPSTTNKTKKNPQKEPEDRGPQVQIKLSSDHLDSEAPFSHHISDLGSIAVRDALLPQPLEPVMEKSFTPPDKQSKGPLTSTPSSVTADFVVDLSPVQNESFGELFPNASNYVNSSEIIPVSSWQESSSNEFPSEICCIIRASPGTRQMRSKDAALNKRYSPEDVPLDIIMKTDGRPQQL
ncbi:meiosis-specific kinetochore protein [Sigmodon hispidus]